MCGIFGLIRNNSALSPDLASAAFVELGRLAVQRGRDSAGFALSAGRVGVPVTKAPPGTETNPDATVDGVRIIKATGTFDALWDDGKHLPLLQQARVAVGHTRWATQGLSTDLANASPLVVGDLVGTHNGDIDITTVADRHLLAKVSRTDTEPLFIGLNHGRSDRRKMVDTLSVVEGRAALAWIDRGRGGRVYLARAALSPLSVAWDIDRNMYWASNPDWFRAVDAKFGGALGFHDITMVREGTLMTVSVVDDVPNVEDVRLFVPRCRASDDRLSEMIVWRGFDKEDTAADQGQANHTVVPSPYALKAGSVSSFAPQRDVWYSQDNKQSAGFRDYSTAFNGRDRASHSDRFAAEEDDVLYSMEVEDVQYYTETLNLPEEVETAILDWAIEGCNPDIVNLARANLTTEQEQRYADLYCMLDVEQFRQFCSAVIEWDDSDRTEQTPDRLAASA